MWIWAVLLKTTFGDRNRLLKATFANILGPLPRITISANIYTQYYVFINTYWYMNTYWYKNTYWSQFLDMNTSTQMKNIKCTVLFAAVWILIYETLHNSNQISILIYLLQIKKNIIVLDLASYSQYIKYSYLCDKTFHINDLMYS